MFEKKFVFIPIHQKNHWSLLVLVLAEVRRPFVISLDFLQTKHDHDEMLEKVRPWLDAEANRLKKCQNFGSFTKIGLPRLILEG